LNGAVLTRIEIDGFKTFKDFALDVPQFLVVLGQNASGKSNLFDALAFLSRLARGESVMQAVRGSRGQLTDLLHRDSAGRHVDTIRFAVELAPRSGPADRIRYRLDLGVISKDPVDPQGTATLAVLGEQLAIGQEHLANLEWVDVDYRPVVQDPTIVSGRSHPATNILRPGSVIPPVAGGDPIPVWVGANDLVDLIRSEIASWRVLACEPSSLRQEDSYDDDDRLSPSGEHLPNTLARIIRSTKTAERPDGVLSDLTNDLATVIPEVVDLQVIDAQQLRRRIVSVTDRGGGQFTAEALSDGTLRALALLTALKDPEQTGLLCVEEPENGVFPKRLGRMIELMREAAAGRNGRQILVTSHSPGVLAGLPPVVGRALRGDAVFLDSASVILTQRGTFSRVTSIRSLRGDASVPLPPGLAGPVMSTPEIDAFLGAETCS
jgi:predicted ATPase